MAAGNITLIVEKGADFPFMLTWKDSNSNPIDLTGYSARMQIRPSHKSSEVILSLSSPDDGITLGTTDGLITVNITNAQSSAIDISAGRYDLELVNPSGLVTRLIEGKIKFKPEVTR